MPLIITAPKSIHDQTALETRVVKAESEIAVQSNEIALRVTETDVTDLLSAADSKTICTSSVTIDAAGIQLESTGAIRLDSGSDMTVAVDGDEKLSIDDQGLSADVVRAESINAPNLILRQPGGAIPWRGSLQATLNGMGKYLGGTCTITAQADANGLTGDTDVVTVSDFIGGYLYIYLTGVTLAHPLYIMNCGSLVLVAGSAASPGVIVPQTAGSYAVHVIRSTAQLVNLRITGAPRTSATGGTQKGVCAAYGSNIAINSCTIERTTARAVDALYGCQVSMAACRGGQTGGAYAGVANLGYMAVLENNCTLSQSGSVPSSALGVYSVRGAVYGTASQLDSEGTVPVITTQTATYTTAVYGRMTLAKGATVIGSTEWKDQYMPRQGSTNTSDYYGCWILNNPNQISTVLSGKTITGITLKLERSASYGDNDSLQVQLWAHPWHTMPTYGADASPIQHFSLIGSLASGFWPSDTRVLDLSAELTTAQYAALKTGLQSGAIKGFGLHGGYGSGSRRYLQMTGVCELTITYEG